MYFKFNDVQDPRKANKTLTGLMSAYQASKKKKDIRMMELMELAIIAGGASVQQCQFPSEFLFQLIDKARWQKRRDEAQAQLEAKLKLPI